MLIDAIASYCTAFFWPLPHILKTIRLKLSPEPAPVLKASPYLNAAGNAASCGSASRNFLRAALVIYGLYGGENYPAFGQAFTFSTTWMVPIVVRNIIGTWLICGFWDWWLYFGPLKDTLFKYKIVAKYPSLAQMKHDAFFTTLSSVIASGFEIVLCHMYATGAIPMVRSLNDKPILHLILALTITHWRIPHFHLVHRMMHPWKSDYLPDFGKFLYKQVHSLHHKSYNITAFSGTNMHPIESTLYYSACLLCIPLGVHPILPLACIFDLAVGAWIGHDGHVYPGNGDYFHQLHHIHFDCNYGAAHIPIDLALGTFASCKDDIKNIWKGKPSGREANDTYVHSDSSTNKVE